MSALKSQLDAFYAVSVSDRQSDRAILMKVRMSSWNDHFCGTNLRFASLKRLLQQMPTESIAYERTFREANSKVVPFSSDRAHLSTFVVTKVFQ